jgi:hypothetical protein
VGDAGEVAEDHAEAVVVGDRDAEAVLRREAHPLADEVAVVEDRVVREGRALGEAGGAGGVLDVDRVVELLLALPRRQFLLAHLRRQRHDLLPGEGAGHPLLAEGDHRA